MSKQKNQENLLSFENFDIYETRRTISSPRSLYACKLEGIEVQELLYRPKEFYRFQDQEIQEMHFQYFEKQRLKIIRRLQKIRKQLIKQEQNRPKSVESSAISNITTQVPIF